MIMFEDYIKESMKLNEMSMLEMSLHSPVQTTQSRKTYNNKYSLSDVKNLFTLAIEQVCDEGYPHNRFSRTIAGISNILLSDFESDVDEIDMNIGLEDEDAEKIINYYYKYIRAFKDFYEECEDAYSVLQDDKDCAGLRDAAKNAYENLYNGIYQFIIKEYPTVKDVLNKIFNGSH